MRQKNKEKSKLRGALRLAAVLLFAASAFLLYFLTHFVMVGTKAVRLSETSADLSGAHISNIEPLKKCTALQYLDLRENNISAEDYRALCEALPGCEIVCTFPIADRSFDTDDARIEINDASSLTEAQLDTLVFAKNLTEFVISGSDVADSCAAKLNGLSADRPECSFRWSVMIGGELFRDDITEIVLPEATDPAEYSRLLLFRQLSTVDATAVGYSDDLAAITQQLEGEEFIWSVNLAGVEVLSNLETADISGHAVEDLDAFSAQLEKLPKLRKLDMCGCGLSNEQMEQLMAAHPDVKFVWYISFAKWKNIRTDILVFSSLSSFQQPYTEADYEPLFKYCTDLVALDLGHGSIRDISGIANLKKLQCVILGHNKIEDISPLAALTELEYADLWTNPFDDISVLSQMPNLHDINLTYCDNIKDFSPLLDLKCPEQIWLQNSKFPESLPDKLKERYPEGVRFSFWLYGNAYGDGWRAQPRYMGYRKAFRNWEYLVEFKHWDDMTFQEGAELLPVAPRPD